MKLTSLNGYRHFTTAAVGEYNPRILPLKEYRDQPIVSLAGVSTDRIHSWLLSELAEARNAVIYQHFLDEVLDVLFLANTAGQRNDEAAYLASVNRAIELDRVSGQHLAILRDTAHRMQLTMSYIVSERRIARSLNYMYRGGAKVESWQAASLVTADTLSYKTGFPPNSERMPFEVCRARVTFANPGFDRESEYAGTALKCLHAFAPLDDYRLLRTLAHWMSKQHSRNRDIIDPIGAVAYLSAQLQRALPR